MQKITFITAHNWETKRFGGFHKFAEAACNAGINTVFFSFPRPYYGLFMHREQINKNVIKKLCAGLSYKVGKAELVNCTFPTLRLPDAVTRYLPDFAANFLLRFSFTPFSRFCRKFLDGTDCFVFESCEGIALFDILKKKFPAARFIYRPSDPLMYQGCLSRIEALERHVLAAADKCLLVNDEGLQLYKSKISGFDKTVTYDILPNGVDTAAYVKKYPVPEPLAKPDTVLYLGAWEIEWPLIYYAAEECPDMQFVVVCPNYPDNAVLEKIKQYANITYIPGVRPSEVPAWITNCSVVMIPYVTGFYESRPLGITAKYYQAIAAGKPIVAYHDTPKLAEIGVAVVYTYCDFVKSIKEQLKKKTAAYAIDLTAREWSVITKRFLDETSLIV